MECSKLKTLNATILRETHPIRHPTSLFFCMFLQDFMRMSACPTIAQVRLASQCDTSESAAASRVVERHASWQTALPRWPSFTVHHSSAWKESETLWNCQANKIEVYFFSQNYRAWPFWFKVLYIDQVAFHCERSFDSIWKLVRTVGCIVPTTRRATLYRRDHKSQEVEVSWRLFTFKSFYKNREKRVWNSEKKKGVRQDASWHFYRPSVPPLCRWWWIWSIAWRLPWRGDGEMETKIFHCHHCRISESLTSTWEGDVGWKVYASPIQLQTTAVTGLTESV